MASKIPHKDGKIGGYLVGRRHSTGGIKAVNVDSGKPLELESDEVIITRRAVLSPAKHDFDGEQLTNLEILSRINQAGGGVPLLEDGGQVGDDYRCKCTGQQFQYQGKLQTDREIALFIGQSEVCTDDTILASQLAAIQAALPFSRGGNRESLLQFEERATVNYKSMSYG